MAGNEVKLTNGKRWSTQQFIDPYQMPNKNGSKTFREIENGPFDSNFDFEHNTLNPLLEAVHDNTIPKATGAGMRFSVAASEVWMSHTLTVGLGELPSFHRVAVKHRSSQGTSLSW
jgi:hypothetical protein